MSHRSRGSAFRIRIALLALAAGTVPAAATHAQVSAAQELTVRLDPETARAVLSLIDSARARGVPGEPLVAKALEGQSKGATGERIVVAVRNLSGDLQAARRILGTDVTGFELVAGAGALRTGASGRVLAELKSLRGTHSMLLPLATLTDLISRGVPVAHAEATVLELAARGAGEADYRAQVGGAVHPAATGAPAAGGVAPAPAVPRPAIPTVTAPVSSPGSERPEVRP